jgi:uncharacterized membrane protein YfcA
LVVAFARYSRDSSFAVLGRNRLFVVLMAAGSVAGTFVGGLLLCTVPGGIPIPALVVIVVLSAMKVWTHKSADLDRPSVLPLLLGDHADDHLVRAIWI